MGHILAHGQAPRVNRVATRASGSGCAEVAQQYDTYMSQDNFGTSRLSKENKHASGTASKGVPLRISSALQTALQGESGTF